MLYVLNLYNVVCQLYLKKKLGGKTIRAMQGKAAQTVSRSGNKTGG